MRIYLVGDGGVNREKGAGGGEVIHKKRRESKKVNWIKKKKTNFHYFKLIFFSLFNLKYLATWIIYHQGGYGINRGYFCQIMTN